MLLSYFPRPALGESDYIAACVEFACAVFPEATALFEPGAGAFDAPRFGNDGTFMPFVALGDFNSRAQNLLNARSKKLAGITAVSQNIFNIGPIVLVAIKSLQRAFSVGDVDNVSRPLV